MKWWKNKIDAAQGPEASALDANALMALARSIDGYEREAAVVELVRRVEPRAIAVLLVCAGDWVLEVRRAAKQGLAVFMRDDFVAHWASALPALAFAYRVRRTDLSDLKESIEEFLARNIDALEQHAPVLEDAMRRWLFTLRLQRTHEMPVLLDLLCRNVRSSDLLTSQLCLNAVDRFVDPEDRRKVFEAACRSRLPRVRMTGMRELLSLSTSDARALISAMCFDSCAGVRSLAVGVLTSETEEIAGRAKDILAQPASAARLAVAALHVLHLLKDSQAVVFARSLTRSPVVALRRMACSLVLSATAESELDVQLMALLADSSPKIRRLAVEHVRRGASLPSPEALIRMGLERREVASDVMAMLGCGSPWDRLHFVFLLLESKEISDTLCGFINVELDAWGTAMANSYVHPQAMQAENLAQLWSRRAELLPKERPTRLLPYGFPEPIEYHLRTYHVI
ncbi:hypothetical protein ACSFBF_09560 [Variovorax sp. ZT5P49]|uniref:hypothetical protein n=1 Tax=Variovorax sp. ZT5P49 TaxID=3443733 RepID=UPI003F446A47